METVKINHEASSIHEAIGVSNEDLMDLINGMIKDFNRITCDLEHFQKWLLRNKSLAKIGAIINIAFIALKFINDKTDEELILEDVMLFSYLQCLWDIFGKPSKAIEFFYNRFLHNENVDFLYKLFVISVKYFRFYFQEISENKVDHYNQIFH